MTFPLAARHLAAAGVHPAEIDRFLLPLNDACAEFDITIGERPAMFLAQIAHESGGFHWMAEIWGPTPAQMRYAGGKDRRGFGAIQVTGEFNQNAEADFFGIPRSTITDWLQTPVGAMRSAGHFWRAHGCNEAADAFDFVRVTKIINGGTTHLEDRLARYTAITAVDAPPK